MKTKLKTLVVLAAISLNTMLSAEEIKLPVISRPAILEEGTQKVLSAAQIAELLPWAKNSKMFLNDLLESTSGMPVSDQVERIAEGIVTVVSDSAPKNSEMLMRYSLNRGLALNEILSKELSNDIVGTQDAKLRILKKSVQSAITYYDADLASLNNAKTSFPIAKYGVEYFNFLHELNKSVFDASAQYMIQRTALEWLQWDLYRDLNNTTYAPQIVKINNALKIFPDKNITDAKAIVYIRQMKQLVESLNLVGLTVKEQVQAKEVETKQTANKNAVRYDSPNFQDCYDLMNISLSSSGAMTECMAMVKNSNINFSSSNFRTCYNLRFTSQSSATAVRTCVASMKASNFDYTNSSFQRCYDLRFASVSSGTAIDTCMDNITRLNFDFNDSNFNACFNKMFTSTSSNSAVNVCVEGLK